MRAAFLLAAVTVGCGVPPEEVDAFRKDVVRLRGEVREARKEAGRAREEVAALNLKAEVHAFLQNDGSLKGGGKFPALGDRVRSESRAITFPLPAGVSRRMAFKLDYRLRVDFVSGSGAAGEVGNRLEVFTRTESFTPLNMQPNEYGAYVFEEGQVLLLATTATVGDDDDDDGGRRRKRKRKRKRKSKSYSRLDAAEIQMRYLPAAGADSRRVAYVRVTFLGPVGEGGEGEGESDASEAPAEEDSPTAADDDDEDDDGDTDEDEDDDADADEGEGAGDGGGSDDGGYDFSDD